ncbi:DUF4038 domain-containing protein [Enterococcus lemanii]|uniref:DUF4038 domain-containing protein n=1 Tax=Enterococcus lemanii TaxID=1159752 RepID=A0ABV9MVL4_9ENTE|nr:DUF4038 domain-containing protein [Enterococcus lemanii]MBM7709731.1 hypothetical protein [Enterococcus lemanii]
MRVTVNQNQRTLLRDGTHFFYLADTCWSAFTSIREEEWMTYLEKRKTQGFNTLQINILPQWDRSRGTFDKLPFSKKNGVYDFKELDDSYFERAKKLCKIADDRGFTLALVVLWSNYVEGTWASNLDRRKNVFPREYFENYFKKVIDTFDSFSPIYFIAGDTDFPEKETIDTYLEAFDYFEKHSPNTLKTVHIKGRQEEIPEEILRRLDLLLYQSGHNRSFLNMPYYLAEQFYKMERKLPIVNSEPCYEQMGYARREYGRFKQLDVRQAAWQSVLSGACAGITYGAHGVWSWHGMNTNFAENTGEAFDTPMYWQEALQLPGAFDYGFIKGILQMNQIDELIPNNQLLVGANEQIRVASSKQQKHHLIYIPSNTTIRVSADFSDFEIYLIDLKTKNLLEPTFVVKNGETIFKIHSGQEDVLLLVKKPS